jgi:hypothetical protein
MQGLYWTLPRDRVEELEDEEESEEEEGEHMTSAAALVEGSVHGGRPDSGGGEQGQPLVSCSRVFENLSSGLTTERKAGAPLACLSAAVVAQSPHCDAEQPSASSCRGLLRHIFIEALDLSGGVRDMAVVRLTNMSYPFGCAMCSNGCQQCSARQPSGASCAGSSWVSAI